MSSENGETQNETPSESDRMDISEVSDQATPISDQSPSETVDNRQPDNRQPDNRSSDNRQPDNRQPDPNSEVLDNAKAAVGAAAEARSTEDVFMEKMLRTTTNKTSTPKHLTSTATTMNETPLANRPEPLANGSDSLANGQTESLEGDQGLGNWSSGGGDSGLSREHSGSRLSLEGLDLELPTLEMYQEEIVDFPSSPIHENFQPLALSTEHDSGNAGASEEEEEDTSIYRAVLSPNCQDVRLKKERPGSLISSQRGGRRKIRVTADILGGGSKDEEDTEEDGDASSAGGGSSRLSDPDALSPGEDDADLDALLSPGVDTPDELEDSILERLGEPPPISAPAPQPIPELTAAEERAESRTWRSCVVQGIERRIDMKVIEPYKRVLSHGGYLAAGSHNAIIVFSACFLPDRSRIDYDYVMDNLFLYVLTTLDQLITEDYVLIYLHGATQRSCMPTFSWLKRCYQLIDRRLRKNLKGLYLVHPTFWLKTIVLMTKPFISSKFSRKLRFVETLGELSSIVPLEQASIPDRVKQYDVLRLQLHQQQHRA